MAKTLKGFTFAAAIASMAMVFAGTALAETKELTTSDGLVTITLPNEKWFQVPSEISTEVFSDGDCAILFDVYRSDDELPGIVKVDDQHLVVYNSAAATKDYVFVATGMVTTEEDYDGIRTAIDSMTVNQDFITDEMLNHKVAEEEFTIEEVSYTALVSADELNVRDASSTEGAVLAVLSRGQDVQVTGNIKKNGEEIGWNRVSVNGMTGYVSAQFLTPVKAAEEAQANTGSQSGSNDLVKTGNTFKLYKEDGSSIIAYEYTDGEYRDDFGGIFKYGRPGVWIAPSGEDVFFEDPTAGSGENYEDTVAPEASGEYFDDSGAGRELYVRSEYDGDRTIYSGANELWYDKDGHTYYQDANSGAFISNADGGSWWYNE